jgi:hypothetical protein
MDNLNDKLSDEAQSQPSCLGAVSGSVSLIMFKIIGGLKQVEFELKAISDHHAISVANDFHYRQGLIGRYYCETSNGKTFSVS